MYSDAIEKLSLVEKAKVLKIKTRRCFRTVKYYKTGSLKLGMIIISLGYQLLKETLITLTDSLKCIMILCIEVRMKELYKLRILICPKKWKRFLKRTVV
jgi:hypothetical protein